MPWRWIACRFGIFPSTRGEDGDPLDVLDVEQKEKELRVMRRSGPGQARKLLKAGAKVFEADK